MGLFDLIEQHHGVGTAADLLRELSPLLMAHIARRRANQPGDGVPLHVFGHIDPDHGVFVPEHGLRQRLAQLRLAHACGAQEQEGSNGTPGILQSHPAPPDGPGHRPDCLVLAHHPLVEGLLHAQQPLALVLRQALDRNARPAGDYGGNVPFHHGPVLGTALAPPVPFQFHLLPVVFLNVPEFRRRLIVLLRNGGVLVLHQGVDLLFQALHLLGGFLLLHADPGRGLIHQVNGLVRKEAVVDIPGGQGHRRLQGLVGDFQFVVLFIPLPQALQDLQAGLLGRLPHLDRLEAAFQGGVLLDIAAVLVQRSGPDDPDLSPAQGGFDDIGGVHGSLCGSGSHDGVEFVNEEDHVPGLLNLR